MYPVAKFYPKEFLTFACVYIVLLHIRYCLMSFLYQMIFGNISFHVILFHPCSKNCLRYLLICNKQYTSLSHLPIVY